MNLIDLANTFMGSYYNAQQNARANQAAQMQRDQMDWERSRAERQDKLQADERARAVEERSLLAEIYKNGPDAAPGVRDRLFEVNPQAAMDLDQRLAQQQQAAQAKQMEGEKIAATMQRALSQARTPEARAAIEQKMFEFTQRGIIPRTEITGPASTGGDVAHVGAQADATLGPEKTPDPTNFAQQVAEETGFPVGTIEHQRAMARIRREGDRARQSVVNVDTGTAAASAKTRADQESDLLDAQDQRAMLASLDDIARDPKTGHVNYGQFLGAVAKGKKFTLDLIDSIDPSAIPEGQRQWYEGMASFRTMVDEYKAGRYNKLLGSAQSAAEVRNLANAVLNADMGSTQFVAAKKRMEQVLDRKIAVAEQVLGEGIPLGSLAYRRRFEDLDKAARSSPTNTARSIVGPGAAIADSAPAQRPTPGRNQRPNQPTPQSIAAETLAPARQMGRPSRTDPTTGETRYWNGSAWVAE